MPRGAERRIPGLVHIFCATLMAVVAIVTTTGASAGAEERTTWSAQAGAAHAVSVSSAPEPQFAGRCGRVEVICQNGELSGNASSCVPDCRYIRHCFVSSSDEPDVGVCVQPHGDFVWVNDRSSDGNGGIGAAFNDQFGQRICRNAHGSGTWARCDWNWPEGSSWDLSGAEADRGILRYWQSFASFVG